MGIEGKTGVTGLIEPKGSLLIVFIPYSSLTLLPPTISTHIPFTYPILSISTPILLPPPHYYINFLTPFIFYAKFTFSNSSISTRFNHQLFRIKIRYSRRN
ncbi:hypothetical protein NBO_1288g0004 [Nosema bombycis CQ1]|uniref:Uncharacterized protein n=1 Tax=Nosema bombycis (strain CQ1 / CVCC 102059) TaxID=578461 RepID=R0KMG0_NOSB1|nr:hypothetical protein NBO_1288g0004 [Nosema bombycis CQ1]|eukprot:EOB11327.1 hypothetical protein NBO_1288g0004 [Nosema bombycis CQ1]